MLEQVASKEEAEAYEQTIKDLKVALTNLRKLIRQKVCVVINGGHELYRARSHSKLYQQCLLCGYETQGWTIDRRDR